MLVRLPCVTASLLRDVVTPDPTPGLGYRTFRVYLRYLLYSFLFLVIVKDETW